FGDFSEEAEKFIEQVKKRPEIGNAFTPFKANFPQYQLDIDFVKAQALGVAPKDLMTAVRGYYARVQAGDFSRFGRQYRIYMQSDAQFTEDAESFKSIFVRNNKGEMVPANTLIKLTKKLGPETVNRYNLFNAITVNATPAAGYSSGDAMEAIEKVADETLLAN